MATIEEKTTEKEQEAKKKKFFDELKTRFPDVPAVKLSKNDEEYLREKFETYASASEWVSHTTYFIKTSKGIFKHLDTESLFNLLATAYKKDKTIKIW